MLSVFDGVMKTTREGVQAGHPSLEGGPVYLDYNATTPVDPRVTAAMLPYFDRWFGNPSSGHSYADRPRRALAEARAQIAALIGARPHEIVFTGSGSEADHPAPPVGETSQRGRAK
jgi:cysteine desulfurase